MEEQEIFLRLSVALAAGLLIGLERGWHERGEEGGTGARIVGRRTFALVKAGFTGVLGGRAMARQAGVGLALAAVAGAGSPLLV